MLMTSERRPAIRTMRGWAIDVLQKAGAIRECEEHGWMQDRTDPHAWEQAIDIAREDPPAGISPDAAAAEVRDVLNSIGDTCPESTPAVARTIGESLVFTLRKWTSPAPVVLPGWK